MSGSSKSNMANADNHDQRWAALDKQHERLVDASHPLLAELRREHPEIERSLPAASLAAAPPQSPAAAKRQGNQATGTGVLAGAKT